MPVAEAGLDLDDQVERTSDSGKGKGGGKRGPKPNYHYAAHVAEIVARIAADGGWKDKVGKICSVLDEAEIPLPKNLAETRRVVTKLGRWGYARAGAGEKGNRTLLAKRRKTTDGETLS